MKKGELQKIIDILTHLNIDYISHRHLSVMIRDKELFDELEDDNHLWLDKVSPIELAQDLKFTEFFSDKESIFNSNENAVLFEEVLLKYTNFMQQYKKRNVKILLNWIISYGKKISIIDINKCLFKRKENKVVIKCEKKKYYFKGESKTIDRFYNLIIDRSIRVEKSSKYTHDEIKEYNVYLFSYLCNVILKNMQNVNLTEIDKILEKINTIAYDFPLYNKMITNEETIPLFKVYRTTLKTIVTYFYEPLSMLQRLCEPFFYINDLVLDKSEIDLFRSIIKFSMTSYSIYRERIFKYFESFTHETFIVKQKNFAIYSEKSTPYATNLIFLNKDIVFIMSNTHCEFKIHGYVIKYDYDPQLLCKTSNDLFNILTTEVSLMFYKSIVELNDNALQWDSEDSIINANLHLITDDELKNYALIYQCDILYKENKVEGKISDINSVINIIDGEWANDVCFKNNSGSTTIYQCNLSHNIQRESYCFNLFTMQLNYKIDSITSSDSRNREDIRYLEKGQISECREAYEILMNREKIKLNAGLITNGRIFRCENGVWIFKNSQIENDDLEFIV